VVPDKSAEVVHKLEPVLVVEHCRSAWEVACSLAWACTLA